MNRKDIVAETLKPTAVIDGDGGVRLACYAQGPEDAPIIIFIHGYPDSAHIWNPVVAELTDTFRCVRYDVRGAGRSERPKNTSDYGLAHLQGDLAAVMDWASPERAVHLVAHDWGSIQTWESVTDPAMSDRIASFTSISGPCLDHAGQGMRDQWRRNRPALVRQLRKSWYIAAFHIPLLPQIAWKTVLGKRFPDTLTRMERQPLPVSPTLVEDGIHGIKLYRANVAKRLLKPRARYAQAPVQVIVPAHDPFVGPSFVNGLDRWVKQLSVEHIKAGHWVIQTRADEIAQLVARFIERQPPADSPVARTSGVRRRKPATGRTTAT